MNKNTENNIVRSVLTVKQFSEKHPAFTEASLRFLIFNESTNGFKTSVRRVGRKVLLDEHAFFDCLDDSSKSKCDF